MKLTLPKNRIAPLIIFAVFSILLLLVLGLYHLNRTSQYSMRTRLDSYETVSNDIVEMIKHTIESNYQTIQNSANLIAKAGELDKENISILLSLLSENSTYVDIAIVGLDGKGYNIAGQEIDISQEACFTSAKNGKINSSEEISYTSDNVPVNHYAVPIMEEGRSKGVLFVSIKAQIYSHALVENEYTHNSFVYLINKDKKLVSYMNDSKIEDFNYDEIIAQGFFIEDYDNMSSIKSPDGLILKGNNAHQPYIWDKKPLGINDWSVLIGWEDVTDPLSNNILRLTNLVWVIVSGILCILFLLMIITQSRTNRKIVKVLYLDPVTGGDNWYKFRMNVSKVLNSRQFTKKKFALINFDVNRFKIINDAYGYHKGDEVLKDIYLVIKKWVRQGELFTRYAADQFYILMAYQEEEEIKDRIHELNDRIHQRPYMSSAKIYFGVYYITERLDYSIDRMGEFAGVAKNNIKGNSEEIISYFDDVTRRRLLKEEEIEKSMNEALKNEEFQVYLQPKYALQEETISGAEALVRWFSSNGSVISPGLFIPVFEKNGFITELDLYMIHKVCGILRNWLDKGYKPLPISVNISRLHFANEHLADIINEIVDNYVIPHDLIELELTESAFLQNKETLINTVIRLRQYGFMVSMDDFGAGYSSLNSLKDLPLDIVKLDGELFRITDEVERGLTVIRNTITMAKDLHMQVVAECIETRDQVEFLCTVGCDIIQGYYYAKPMPVDQFEKQYLLL
ncbi:EAL domain-containing protein [Lachnospiraceae bacterium MD1]|uniref:EAL domain-containing protein n=1 Tax=Variimorphobacter saccharofermentans TaxID=2755051 RepID=A0A839K5Y4_9FIRM|nr:EAL domain-containing protein [Variimorphobacter saccharofermentans]MBB2184727.1 EAL domain-containing protein [Variimorphobacter saccharofermentans]